MTLNMQVDQTLFMSTIQRAWGEFNKYVSHARSASLKLVNYTCK